MKPQCVTIWIFQYRPSKMDFDENLKTEPSTTNNFVRKSLSSVGLCTGYQNLTLREAKSLTGDVHELKLGAFKETNVGRPI